LVESLHTHNALVDFVVNRLFMKLFKTNDINIVIQCQREFNFSIPSDILVRRSEKFENRYRQCDSIFVNTRNYIVRHVLVKVS